MYQPCYDRVQSHPTRVRGLKCSTLSLFVFAFVAPYTGAWIEIPTTATAPPVNFVAPYTGAWIEIIGSALDEYIFESHPTRVRGLK